MRGTGKGIGLLALVLLGLSGCVTSENQLKPPPIPEQYNSPPADDARYTNPPAYPKEVLNRPLLRQTDPGTGPGGVPGRGGLGGVGGGAGTPPMTSSPGMTGGTR